VSEPSAVGGEGFGHLAGGEAELVEAVVVMAARAAAVRARPRRHLGSDPVVELEPSAAVDALRGGHSVVFEGALGDVDESVLVSSLARGQSALHALGPVLEDGVESGIVQVRAATVASSFRPPRPIAAGTTFPVLQSGIARYHWDDEEACGMIERSARLDL
jgi:hypothetical protein